MCLTLYSLFIALSELVKYRIYIVIIIDLTEV